MEELVHILAHYSVNGLETMGIVVIATVAVVATGYMVVRLAARRPLQETFHTYRHALIRGTLVGLELLVGADIIRTVTVEFNLENVGTLSVLVLIRTFLSFSLEVELNGRWPWQSGKPPT